MLICKAIFTSTKGFAFSLKVSEENLGTVKVAENLLQ